MDKISPITDKITLYLDDKQELIKILKLGRDKVEPLAQKNIIKIKEIMGLGNF